MAYTGTSIVDYLNSTGGDSSYAARKALATQYGINNYSGTADQNTQLLQTLQSGTSGSKTYTAGDPYYSPTGEYQGTVQYDAQTGAKLSSGQTTTQLSAMSAPTNAGLISPSSPTNLPQLSPYYGNISNASALSSGAQSYLDTQSQILADRQKMEEEIRNQIAKTESGKQEKSLLQKFLSSDSPTETRDNAYNQINVDPKEYFADQKAKVAEINTLTQEYNSVKGARDQAIATSFDKLASNSFINNQQAQIERNAAPKLNELSANINAKAALLQALQGNFREAQNFVNQAVEDSMANRKFFLENYQMLKSENEDLFSKLSKPYEDAYNLKLDLVQQDYEQTLADKKTIGQLMIENPGAAIDIYNDTLEEALQKVASTGGSLDARRESRISTSGTPTGGGTTSSGASDLLQQALSSGLTAEQAARDVAGYYESLGIPVSAKQIDQWTAEAKQLKTSPTTTPSSQFTTQPVSFSKSQLDSGGLTIDSQGSFFSNLFGG